MQALIKKMNRYINNIFFVPIFTVLFIMLVSFEGLAKISYSWSTVHVYKTLIYIVPWKFDEVPTDLGSFEIWVNGKWVYKARDKSVDSEETF